MRSASSYLDLDDLRHALPCCQNATKHVRCDDRGCFRWSAEQLKLIVDSVPKTYRSLFQCAMLTSARLGESHGLARNFKNPGDLQEGIAEGFGCGGWI
jgi:hypothetical protein